MSKEDRLPTGTNKATSTAGQPQKLAGRAKVLTGVMVAGIAAAIVACNTSDISGPKTGATGISATGAGSANALISADDGPEVAATHEMVSDEQAANDPDFQKSTTTTFPMTEAVYNACRGELVVLNGYLKRHTAVSVSPNGDLKVFLHEWKDTRNVEGSAQKEELVDTDGNPATPPEKRTTIVKYHNHDNQLNAFHAGPAGLPYWSHFLSVMHLQREGKDPLAGSAVGDDLYVFVHQIVKISKTGTPTTQDEFRAECQ
jgi:hypothetical protein